MKSETEAAFYRFTDLLRTKMEVAEIKYKDYSMETSLPSTVDEIEEELIDICGWSVVLFVKLQRLRKVLDAL